MRAVITTYTKATHVCALLVDICAYALYVGRNKVKESCRSRAFRSPLSAHVYSSWPDTGIPSARRSLSISAGLRNRDVSHPSGGDERSLVAVVSAVRGDRCVQEITSALTRDARPSYRNATRAQEYRRDKEAFLGFVSRPFLFFLLTTGLLFVARFDLYGGEGEHTSIQNDSVLIAGASMSLGCGWCDRLRRSSLDKRASVVGRGV